MFFKFCTNIYEAVIYTQIVNVALNYIRAKFGLTAQYPFLKNIKTNKAR